MFTGHSVRHVRGALANYFDNSDLQMWLGMQKILNSKNIDYPDDDLVFGLDIEKLKGDTDTSRNSYSYPLSKGKKPLLELPALDAFLSQRSQVASKTMVK